MTDRIHAAQIDSLASDYPTGSWIAPHAHDAHQIIHAKSGVLQVVSRADTWFVPPGRAIWMPAERGHAIRCRTAVEMRTVYVHGPVPGLPATCSVWTVSPLMREILIRLADSPNAGGRDHLVALLFLEVEEAGTLPLRLPLPLDPRLRRLTDALSARPADARPLKHWAGSLGLSERNLTRRFSIETGMSFRQWRRQVRLLSALERLISGEQVTTVAFAVGYESVSAFVAAFRDAFGVTPGRYAGGAGSRTGKRENPPPRFRQEDA